MMNSLGLGMKLGIRMYSPCCIKLSCSSYSWNKAYVVRGLRLASTHISKFNFYNNTGSNHSLSTNSNNNNMSYDRFITENAKKRKPSLIREMTKMLNTVKPGTIFMAGGLPNADLFPVESFSFAIDSGTKIEVAGPSLKAALQYQSTQGYPPLLDSLRDLQLNFHNPPNWKNSDIIVTVGSQQGLSGVLEMTIANGDPVIVPAPVYSSTLSIMDPLSPHYLSVPTDLEGMDPKLLLELLQNYEQTSGSTKMPKIIYVNPTGANPSGVNIPLSRKQEIYQIAQRYDLLILEDDPYYFLHFERDNPRSFLSIDTEGRVVRFDSFSKILSAGIRIGFVTGPKDFIRHLELSMQTSVLHASSLSQVLVDEILRKWSIEGFTRHTEKAREFYKKRRDVMLYAAQKHLEGLAEFNVPGGGMFLWMKILGVKDTYEMVMKHGIAEGILLLPGNQFFPDRNAPCPYLRAAFSTVSFTDMTKLSIGSGLLNIGNSCFFNATLQALFNIPSITECLQNKIRNNAQRCECVSCVFLDLYNKTRFNKPCDPTRLYSALYNSSRKKFAPILNFQQQDAHEFLMLFSEYVGSELHSAFSFDEIFVSNIVTDIECSRCKNVFKSSCVVTEFQLDVFRHKSVKNAFDSYFKDQSVDYDCGKCKKKHRSKQKSFLLSAPQCIMLTLKRYSKSNKKLKSRIEVTRELKLSQYFSVNQTLQWNYKLVAVVNHVGKSVNSGHYSTIACNEANDHYLFDDSNVNKIDSNTITGENEYMLFYEYIEEPDVEKNTPNEMENNEETDADIEGLTEIEIIDDLDSSKDKGQDLQSLINDLSPQNGDMEQWAEVEFIENIDTSHIYNLQSPNSGLEQWTEVEIIDDPETSRVPDLTEHFETASELMNKKEVPQRTENERRYEIKDGLQNQIVSDQCVDNLSGRRIIDIHHLFKQMQDMTENVCKLCNEGGMIFSNEFKKGLISIFTFRCDHCGNTKRIESTPVKNNGAANPNEGSVLGIISIGLGFYHLQEFLSHLNIKCMSYPTFHKLEKRFQADWWEVAKKFEADALDEEIRLSKENLEVDSAGNALIGVEFDGSWEKRAYTNNFSSLAGCAAIIGRRTNKILYSGVKTKYCHVCKIAQSQNTPVNKHECNANYVGPSSGMETAIIIDGFKFCEEKGARFHYYVGDGDSSIYKALRDLRLYKNPDMDTEKYECINHLFRNFTKKCDKLTGLTKFKRKGRKLLPSNLGRNICKGVRMASKHWRQSDIDLIDKYANLERDIMNAPMHYFGVHDNCEKYFCQKQTEPGVESVIAILKETGLYYTILDMCQSYFANNVKSLIAGYSTNKTEGFNSLIAKNIGGKRICNSTAGSYKGRTAIADVQFNTRGHSGSTFHELIFGNRMQSCSILENTRKRKVEKNAIARQAKPKKRRLDEDTTTTTTTTKKNKKTKRYGLGREDVDKTPAEFEVAKKRFLESVSENQINRENIEIETRAQRLSLKWLLTRRKMVATSYFGRILNVQNRKSYTKIVEDILYKDDQHANTAEIRHQRAYEREALEMFSQEYRHESIDKCGLFIDEEFGFLGASPFRLYGKDGIVMVKCPKKAFNKSFNFAIKKKLIPIWIGGPNNRQLNIKSHWYIELQGQLHITGRHMGYLVVYLGESVYEILELERNHKFWKENMERELVFFYNEALLKEIVDPREEREMDIREYNVEKKTFL